PEPQITAPPHLDELRLPASRLRPPAVLAAVVSDAPHDRAAHTYGKSFRDVVRALRREFSHAPDVVAFPRSEDDVRALLDWAATAGAAVIPYGGGSSVVGGVEADVGKRYPGAVSLDLSRLDRVLEVDRTSRAARIQAGVLGPALEDQLRPHGLTLRHFPQSFEFSSLCGWIATRSGGHYATLYTHIDEFVESLRVVTPAGVVETRRLPGSGAGPSPDRLFIGSEGILGVITEAWMRLQDRRTRKAEEGARDGAAGAWRKSFLDAPYLRDALVAMGMISETFETAITWDRFPAFHRGVTEATEEALRLVCGGGQLTCRFTHVYPDGPAPYYTVIAPGRRGAELEQWAAIKQAASDAILRLGGTITHHHAVGRHDRPWYARARPAGFAAALAAAKAALDPAGVLNPGVLIDPR